jgi:hypothetical protein
VTGPTAPSADVATIRGMNTVVLATVLHMASIYDSPVTNTGFSKTSELSWMMTAPGRNFISNSMAVWSPTSIANG